MTSSRSIRGVFLKQLFSFQQSLKIPAIGFDFVFSADISYIHLIWKSRERHHEGAMMRKYYSKTTILLSVFLLSLLFFPGYQAFSQNITSPEDHFGFQVGADYHLIDYEQAVEYWKKLEAESPRIRLFEYGKSSDGRPMVLAAVSAEENLAKLDRYKEISKRLSLVKGLSEEEAELLAAQGKAIVWIDGGLHATEVAPAQHIIQLTYDLIHADSPKMKNILDNVICLLVLPNPDGMDMVAEWYGKNLNTPYETCPLPWLYQRYIGHDNNRDSYMMSVAETQNINHVVNHDWYPHIFYNHHQRSPFPTLIFIPPDCEPTNPNLHPLLLRWQNFIGAAIAMAFESEGKQGVISRFLFDTWYPGYVTQICDFHNIISTFSETFLFSYASPRFYSVRDFPPEYRDFTTSLFFTNPWQGGWWRLRDAVEYCLTSSKAVLDIAAKHREEILYAKYAMGKETTERYKNEPPFGWIIPLQQRDPGVTTDLLNKLITLDIDVYQAEEPFKADGIDYPGGTYILPTSQPFGRLLKTLFEIQVYPDLRKYPFLWQSIVEPIELKIPPLQSYDVLGWTLPLQMGVKTVTMNTPVQVKMNQCQKVSLPKGGLSGTGHYGYLIPYETNNAVKAINRTLKEGADVYWSKASFNSSGKNSSRHFSAGTLIIPQTSISDVKMRAIAEDLDLQVSRISKPAVETIKLKKPRLALYQSWTANIDEGWTRLILENYGFPYTSVHNAEIRAGGLENRFDTIILPSQSPGSIINGHRKGTMPPEYVGGILDSGMNNLKSFVESGGTLVAMDAACDLPIEKFHLPVTDITKKLKPDEFFASGLLLNVVFDQNHPVAFGMPEETAGFYAQSPVFQTWAASEDKSEVKIIGRYPGENIMLSGWMLGENYLRNKAAAVEVKMGKGKIILLGFNVQHRGQTAATFKLLFNSLFYSALSN
jgi:hypothetical protein